MLDGWIKQLALSKEISIWKSNAKKEIYSYILWYANIKNTWALGLKYLCGALSQIEIQQGLG